jgi:hypothetical protein
MATSKQILEDQVIRVKRGRISGLGFEPCFNVFFDYYLSSKYFDPPLLQFEDVTFFLYLRKNINDSNPNWKMPTIRQIMRKFSVSYSRLKGIFTRLSDAKLLEKLSGVGKGDKGENVPNEYILSDPIQTLDEFLQVALSGFFTRPLKEQWLEYFNDEDPCRENRDTPSRYSIQLPVSEIATHKQTSIFKQGGELDILWDSVLEVLKTQLPPATFRDFMEPTLLTDLTGGVATVTIPPKAKDWIENRLARQLKQLLSIEGKMKVETICVVIQNG